MRRYIPKVPSVFGAATDKIDNVGAIRNNGGESLQPRPKNKTERIVVGPKPGAVASRGAGSPALLEMSIRPIWVSIAS